jgi:hypothetical protein
MVGVGRELGRELGREVSRVVDRPRNCETYSC